MIGYAGDAPELSAAERADGDVDPGSGTVEDQCNERVYGIGQSRAVEAHLPDHG